MSRGRRSALSETVARGADDFVFQRFERTFEQVCGEIVLEGRALERWISLIEARHAWCAVRKIPYLFFVVPEKHVIYSDKLPFGEISPRRPAVAIRDGLSSLVQRDFVYPVEELIEARATDDPFYRTDVHWSPWGAYVGYRALLAVLSTTHAIEPIAVESLRRTRNRFVGDLGIRLDEEVEEEATHLALESKNYVKVMGNDRYTVGQVEVYESDSLPKLRCVLFRDSNGTALLPYLANIFSRLVVVASQEFYHEVIRSECPDVVITQTTERQLARPADPMKADELIFPTDFDKIGFNEVARLALPLPTRDNVVALSFRVGGNSGPYRGAGWSHEEIHHIWMIDAESWLSLPQLEPGLDYEIEIDVVPFINTPDVSQQRYTIRTGAGVILTTGALTKATTLSFNLPAHVINGDGHKLVVEHPDGAVPPSPRKSEDARKLSISVHEVRIRPNSARR